MAFVMTRGEGDASAAWIGHRDLSSNATADPSRWTHRGGVRGRARNKTPPPRNAIGLSSPVGERDERCDWRAKPVAFRPPPSYVPKAAPSAQGEAKRRRANFPKQPCACAAMTPGFSRSFILSPP